MSAALYRLGRLSARRPWRVVAVWLAVALAVTAAAASFGRPLDDSIAVPGLDSQQAIDLLARVGADDAGLTAYVVAAPRAPDTTFFTSPEARRDLATLHTAVAGLDHLVAATDPAAALAGGPDEAIAAGAVSADGRVALLRLQYPVRDALGIDDLHRLEEALAATRAGSSLLIEGGGDLYFSFQQPATGTGEIVGLLVAVLVLFLAFGSLLATGVPIGTAIVGLAVSIGSLSLLTYVVDIPTWSTQIGVMVGLGVGIDYALFLVSRHRELLSQGLDVETSLATSVATAGQAIVFAGGTVVIAILGLAVAGIPFVTNGGIGISVIVATMVLAAITLVPALLGLAGRRITKVRVGRTRTGQAGRSGTDPGAPQPAPSTAVATPASTTASATAGVGMHLVSPRWERWGRHVSRHAPAYAIGAVVGLLALAAPVLSLRLGFPDDGTLPPSRTERRAYDLIADGFGAGTNGPLLVAVELHGDETVLPRLAEALAADPGIAAVAPPTVHADAGVATIVAIPRTAPQDAATLDTIGRVRSSVLPAALAGSPADAHVGGATATWGDLGEQVRQRLPWFIAAVVVLSFVLLLVVFRSVLVPLKAACMNLLSIGAAYGVMVLIFQWGWGKDLIGLAGPVPIIPFIPMFMFAILFGLSMDYEVFLLTRIREEHVAGADNETAVIRGLGGTARVITSAAVIMISVFVAFALGDDPSIKMFGIGLATAVLVDATVVRLVLVPATMRLLGEANWWLPDWLDRLLPVVDLEGGHRSAADHPRSERELDLQRS